MPQKVNNTLIAIVVAARLFYSEDVQKLIVHLPGDRHEAATRDLNVLICQCGQPNLGVLDDLDVVSSRVAMFTRRDPGLLLEFEKPIDSLK